MRVVADAFYFAGLRKGVDVEDACRFGEPYRRGNSPAIYAQRFQAEIFPPSKWRERIFIHSSRFIETHCIATLCIAVRCVVIQFIAAQFRAAHGFLGGSFFVSFSKSVVQGGTTPFIRA